jgi:hypothetical protein
MAEVTQKNPKGAGRPPSLTNQTEGLVKRVMAANKKIDTGLSKIADEYPELIATAMDMALGRGYNTDYDGNGVLREIPRNPNVQMLKNLIDIGINMVDKTGEGPDSPSQRILSAMHNKITQLTQVNIDHITILDSDNNDREPNIETVASDS